MQKGVYKESILLVERLHRRFLDVVKAEIDRLHIDDINNVQTLILYNINDEQLTVGELTNRGYYLGSNVSYNVKKLVENGYLLQEKAPHDRRSTRVRLSDKGLKLVAVVDALYERHIASFSDNDITREELESLNQSLLKLEKFWSECLNQAYKLGSGSL